MKIDALVAEIGSTTTVVNAFVGIHNGEPLFLGQGQAPTSVNFGDVNIGLNQAIDNLKENLDTDLEIQEIFATSSAAGGLKMTVHGLVYDMTVKAAEEAALGAGANIHLVTSGNLTEYDIQKIKNIKPNIILIAGGVDYGEKATALNNAYEIASLQLDIPVIYAGNCTNHYEISDIFNKYKQEQFLHITENVYPKIDELNVEPTRKIIQDVFEKHIIHAPGMNYVREMVKEKIIPTPGAVMHAAKLLEKEIGDLLIFDVGGATTDLHSVTSGSDEINRILISPEPHAKRTVEGDLGVYINRHNIINMIGFEQLCKDIKTTNEELTEILNNYEAIPKLKQIPLVERLTKEALVKALNRHCGSYRNLYGSQGRVRVAQGKDLTNIKYIIGTGGALTRLPNRFKLLKELILKQDSIKLMPTKDVGILIDKDYLIASCGVLSFKYPNEALKLIKVSLGLKVM